MQEAQRNQDNTSAQCLQRTPRDQAKKAVLPGGGGTVHLPPAADTEVPPGRRTHLNEL